MSLLGIDVGTTGVKAVVFTDTGLQFAAAYEEYDFVRPAPGWAQLDTEEVWLKTQRVIRRCASESKHDPIEAISFSSMGEAMVPVTKERRILGPSINPNFDLRGEVYLSALGATMNDSHLYDINGNTLGHNYSLVSLKWIKDNQPQVYNETDHFLLWGDLIPFMLGAEARSNHSLANRTLLFDLQREDWSDELVDWAGLDREKLPKTVSSGKEIGRVPEHIAKEVGLPVGALLISGAHDQCATALGCGVIKEGLATFGMGTFFNISPVFRSRRDTVLMMERGISTEHHAVPGLFISFLYNLGGALVKWYRDSFAAAEYSKALGSNRDIYSELFAEMPSGPSSILVLPHFGPTGPPDFLSNSRGVFVGLQLDTLRGDILKGIVEGVAFYLKEVVDTLPPTGISINEYRATGGGARSDVWLQVVADIMGLPVVRPAITEAGSLGAAILAGQGSGRFSTFQEGVDAMVSLEQVFEPNSERQQRYQQRYLQYKNLWLVLRDYLAELSTG